MAEKSTFVLLLAVPGKEDAILAIPSEEAVIAALRKVLVTEDVCVTVKRVTFFKDTEGHK